MSKVLGRLGADLPTHYTVECELGQGGMALVYLARDLRHDRRIAIKILRPELGSVVATERFLREIKLTAKLTHPHILPLLDSGEAGGLPYYIMPHVAGDSLRTRLEREKQLPVDEALRICREVADALSYAHNQGVLHRDIKPENVLLEGGHAVVADFGIAKALSEAAGERLTDTGVSIGTPAYMSPEQAAGDAQLDERSDVYSLACVLYECLTGELPYAGTNPRAIIAQKILGEIRPLRNLATEDSVMLNRILRKALEPVPARRLSSARELSDTIEHTLATRLLQIHSANFRSAAAALDQDDCIVLAEFEDRTGDPSLAVAVTEAFRIDMAQSPFVRLVGTDYVAQLLQLMGKPPDTDLSSDIARELALRGGIKAVITGQVNRVGSSVILSARLLAARDGAVISAHRETAADSTMLIAAIDRLSKRLRELAGESLKSIQAHEPLERVTTSSVPALQRFSLATRAWRERGEYNRAVALFEEAVELDPTFATAYHALALLISETGHQRSRVKENLGKALKYQDRLSRSERLHLQATYHRLVTRNREKAIDAYRSALEATQDRRWNNDVALLYAELGNYAEAESLLTQLTQANPLLAVAYMNIIEMQVAQGKFPEAESTLQQLAEVQANNPDVDLYRANLSAARGEYSAAIVHFGTLQEKQKSSSYWQAITNVELGGLARLRGRIREAEGYIREAMAIYAHCDNAVEYLQSAVFFAELVIIESGKREAGLRELQSALEPYRLSSLAPLDRPYLVLAEFYASAGQLGEARRLIAEYSALGERQRDEPDLHRALGAIAVADGRWGDAIEEYRAAYDVWCPIYSLPMLGESYELAAQPELACTVYEQYVATPWYHRAILSRSRHLGSVYERLGELCEQRRDRSKAICYYGKLARLWQDADPELQPRVEAARQAIQALSLDK